MSEPRHKVMSAAIHTNLRVWSNYLREAQNSLITACLREVYPADAYHDLWRRLVRQEAARRKLGT